MSTSSHYYSWPQGGYKGGETVAITANDPIVFHDVTTDEGKKDWQQYIEFGTGTPGEVIYSYNADGYTQGRIAIEVNDPGSTPHTQYYYNNFDVSVTNSTSEGYTGLRVYTGYDPSYTNYKISTSITFPSAVAICSLSEHGISNIGFGVTIDGYLNRTDFWYRTKYQERNSGFLFVVDGIYYRQFDSVWTYADLSNQVIFDEQYSHGVYSINTDTQIDYNPYSGTKHPKTFEIFRAYGIDINYDYTHEYWSNNKVNFVSNGKYNYQIATKEGYLNWNYWSNSEQSFSGYINDKGSWASELYYTTHDGSVTLDFNASNNENYLVNIYKKNDDDTKTLIGKNKITLSLTDDIKIYVEPVLAGKLIVNVTGLENTFATLSLDYKSLGINETVTFDKSYTTYKTFFELAKVDTTESNDTLVDFTESPDSYYQDPIINSVSFYPYLIGGIKSNLFIVPQQKSKTEYSISHGINCSDSEYRLNIEVKQNKNEIAIHTSTWPSDNSEFGGYNYSFYFGKFDPSTLEDFSDYEEVSTVSGDATIKKDSSTILSTIKNDLYPFMIFDKWVCMETGDEFEEQDLEIKDTILEDDKYKQYIGGDLHFVACYKSVISYYSYFYRDDIDFKFVNVKSELSDANKIHNIRYDIYAKRIDVNGDKLLVAIIYFKDGLDNIPYGMIDDVDNHGFGDAQKNEYSSDVINSHEYISYLNIKCTPKIKSSAIINSIHLYNKWIHDHGIDLNVIDAWEHYNIYQFRYYTLNYETGDIIAQCGVFNANYSMFYPKPNIICGNPILIDHDFNIVTNDNVDSIVELP